MRQNFNPKNPNKFLQTLQYAVFISAILYFGKNLFIPLSFALLISFTLFPICNWIEQKGVNRLASILASITLLVAFVVGAIALLIQQLVSFINEWPTLKLKFEETFTELSQVLQDNFAITKDQQDAFINQFIQQSSGDLVSFIKDSISISIFWTVMLILIPVLAALILYYRNLLAHVLYRIFPNERRESINTILLLTTTTYYNFIKGMIIVYFIVGILNSLGLLFLGIPHAIFFGFTAAVLTFIPYVGILVGSLLPISMAWITYNSILYPLGVIGVFALVQYLEANIIFPIAVSQRLKINALVTLLAILAGGILWGISGMILFVPFLAITKLIAEHHPKMKTLEKLLGENII